MKRILTEDNYVQLQELTNTGVLKLQLGYSIGGLTYKIENNNVKFYLKDDYFYKNCIFSADLPLNINGVYYDDESIGEGMAELFDTETSGVSSVNGKTGDVTLTAEDVDAYTKDEVDNLIDDVEVDIDALEQQVGANTTAIGNIQTDIANKEHFRGYFATNVEIQSLTATNGDFAFSAQSGTKWAYNNNAWTDTETEVPDQTVEKADTTPLMDGVAVIGSSNKYAAADHIHPTDTSRASQSDLAALSASKQDKLTAGQNITIDENNVISAQGGGGGTQVQSDWNQTNVSAVDYIKNKPTIPTVPTNVSAFTNDAGYLTQHQSLANYYTKTESDTKFALKFTDVDDIQLVSSLPANPDSRTLYLIPVQ